MKRHNGRNFRGDGGMVDWIGIAACSLA